MLAVVSPVMVGAEAASPQPTKPLSASMRTSTLSARATVSPAMVTGFFIGRLTAIGSIDLIFTQPSPLSGAASFGRTGAMVNEQAAARQLNLHSEMRGSAGFR